MDIASIAGKGGPSGRRDLLRDKYGSSAERGASPGVARLGGRVSVVMPIGVNTELYSGLSAAARSNTPSSTTSPKRSSGRSETGRYEVYVPRTMAAAVRLTALLPLRVSDAGARMLKADQALTQPDHSERAAYEARVSQTVSAADEERETEAV